jgi:multiple sugar transport system substrate-binding protein
LATGKADLTVIYWGGQQDKETNSKIIDQYTSAHPQVHVTATLVTGSFDDKLQAMVAGGTPPDVFEMAEAFVGYAAKGVTLDLSQFIKQTNFDLGDFYPNILRAYTYQGKVEGIPPRGGPMVLFYNKDLFNKVGATMPTAGWTWDDFMTATTKLSVGVGDTKTYGIGSGNWWPWWMSAVYQNGGSVLNHDKTQATLDTDAAIGGLQWFSDWFNKYKIAPNATESKTLPKGGGDQWIVQGKTGMDETGFWAVSSNDKAAGFNWAAAPLPKGKVAATVLFSNAWCLTSEGKQQAAAFDLVTALTSKPSQEIIAKTRQDMPTRKSVATSAVFTGDEPADHTQAFITSEDMIIDMPITPQWNQMLSGKVTGNIINDLIAGKTDASTAGKQMTTNINTALKG